MINQKILKRDQNIKEQVKLVFRSLELVKEGNLSIKQENLFDDIYIKENK